MSKKKLALDKIAFRPAQASEAKLASRLLFDTFPQKATFIIGLGNAKRAKKILADIFPLPGHRLSYELTKMVIYNQSVVGALLVFPGQMMGRLNWGMYKLILRQYQLHGKIALIFRAWPLLFIKETARDEYFLCNLVVRHQYRGQGIGKKMLEYIEGLARESGFSKIALMVNLGNEEARRFYDRHGYTVTAINLESNRRVPYLGPGYERRVKDLSL